MVYVFLADGFEETEALAPVDILRRCGVDVKTVGVGGDSITGSHQITVVPDIADSQVTTDGLEAVVLPGGMPGTLNLEKSPIVKACVEYCVDNDLPVCAICAAPSILGHMGVLKGKKATCFPGFEQELTGAVVCQDKLAVTDGKIVTGKGAGAAIEFGLAVAALLAGEEKSRKVREALQCR
ncbi:DJ-1 family glyoxalase III [Ruminococcus sp. zg-924]|uniref:DJ-1 family glyoxalase III n=1 Tax=Ruminococcus sp. zg-924 TaxID=2678505 RepID=UPI00210EE13B|nr:DJ-1 family glyoxalase III [Ruminococcus sp. zg-924]MCQ4023193.1 DJ-1 family protein [Ruminococcus sp. zg-924]